MSDNTLALLAAATSSDAGGAIVVLVVFLVVLALIVLAIVGGWKMFKKAGRPGWTVLVPFYKEVVLLEMVNLPRWWVLILICVPVVNLFVYYKVCRRLGIAFGKPSVGFAIGLFLLPFIFVPILGFGKSTYSNTFPPARPMSDTVKWTLIALAAFAAMEGLLMLMSHPQDGEMHSTQAGSPMNADSSSWNGSDGSSVQY